MFSTKIISVIWFHGNIYLACSILISLYFLFHHISVSTKVLFLGNSVSTQFAETVRCLSYTTIFPVIKDMKDHNNIDLKRTEKKREIVCMQWWFYLAFSAVGDEVPLFCCVCSGMEVNELVLGSNMIDGYSNCPRNIEFTWSKLEVKIAWIFRWD